MGRHKNPTKLALTNHFRDKRCGDAISDGNQPPHEYPATFAVIE